MKVRGAMKQRAENAMEQTRDILSEAVAGQPEAVLSRLPKEATLKRHIMQSIERKRNTTGTPTRRPTIYHPTSVLYRQRW